MFIVINHLSEASFKPLCAHFHTVQRLIENTSAFKNKYSMFQKMVSYNIKYMYSVANGQTHTRTKTKKKRYSPFSCPLNFAMPCLCYNCKFKHSLKLLSVLCKHFKTSAYRITLWQLMICKIQLTVCKHKKAVGNEKRAKTSKIDKAFMTAWHFPSTGTTATFPKISMSCTFKFDTLHFSYSTFFDKQKWGGLHMNIKMKSRLWQLHNWLTTQTKFTQMTQCIRKAPWQGMWPAKSFTVYFLVYVLPETLHIPL